MPTFMYSLHKEAGSKDLPYLVVRAYLIAISQHFVAVARHLLYLLFVESSQLYAARYSITCAGKQRRYQCPHVV